MCRLAFGLTLAVGLFAATAMLESRDEGRVAVEGRGEAMVLDFRPDSARGWKITNAKLYLFVSSGPVLKKMPVSTVTVEWSGGDAGGVGKGVFGKGGSVEAECTVRELKQGWVEVDLPAELIEALAAGRSHGFAWLPGNMRVNGRTPVLRQPYILVEGGR